MKHKKLANDFGKFLFVGVIWTVLSIFIMWILIDVLGMYGWLGSSIAVVIVLIGRFYTYLLVRLIHNQFIKYISANIGFSIATVGLMSLFVDILKIPAKISSPIIIGGIFILKFVFFKKIKLIKE